jgi:hypothetical protein
VRRCKHCGDEMLPAAKCTDRLGKQRLCSIDCAAAWGLKAAEKVRTKKQKSESSKAKRERNDNSLSHQLELTRKEFNTMIRAMDAGKTCPDCGEPLIDGQYDAGHVRTVAACPELRFDARAVFGQKRSCNGSGTIRKRTRRTQEAVSGLYREWIIREKGQDYHDWLYGPHDAKHWQIHELKQLRSICAAETRRIESGENPIYPWRDLNFDILSIIRNQ